MVPEGEVGPGPHLMGGEFRGFLVGKGDSPWWRPPGTESKMAY